eukprot:8637083-Alexandrium_andersonii.AAC.1
MQGVPSGVWEAPLPPPRRRVFQPSLVLSSPPGPKVIGCHRAVGKSGFWNCNGGGGPAAAPGLHSSSS